MKGKIRFLIAPQPLAKVAGLGQPQNLLQMEIPRNPLSLTASGAIKTC